MEKKKSQLADEFRVEFITIKEKIVRDTAELDQVPVVDLKEKINSIYLDIQNLKVKLQDSSKYLPAYTSKVCAEPQNLTTESDSLSYFYNLYFVIFLCSVDKTI